MARWLFKEEPTHFAYTDLVRERRTEWNGVHNPLALRHLRAAKVGDLVFYYHSGGVRSILGIARVSRGPRADDSDGRRSWSVEISPVRALARAIPLSELKTDPALDGFVLFRIGRLSVMPVTEREWSRVLVHEMAGAPAPPPKRARGVPRAARAA